MREFFDRLKLSLATFMEGRYGNDNLNTFLLIIAIIFILLQSLVGIFIGLPVFQAIGTIALVLAIFRSLSKNCTKRLEENEKYLQITKGPKKFFKHQSLKWKNRKTTLYFKCSGCKTNLSVPKGKGKIRIVCPKCKKEIYKTT